MDTIVFGFDSYNTAGSIRCLGEAGFRPTLILVKRGRGKNAVLKSKYLGQSFSTESVEDGIRILLKLKDHIQKRIVFASSDAVAKVLDNHYDELKDNFIFSNVGKQGGLNQVMEKDFQCRVAADTGIRIPYSIAYRIGDILPSYIPYPCIVKPLKSTEGSKQDINIISNQIELIEFFNNDHITKTFLIQQLVDMDEELLIIGCRTLSGKVIIGANIRANRWVEKGDAKSYGIISRGLPRDCSFSDSIVRAEECIAKFVESLNYVGLFSIEYGIEKGKAYFFEINLRNDGTINYYTKIGINIPEMFILDQDTTHAEKPKEAFFIDEFGDINNLLRGRITIKDWVRDFRRATVYKYYDSKDRGPFYVFAPKMIRVVLANVLRKVTRRL